MTDFATKERVALQHLENTGRNLLDSGDYYGRGYERSQKEAELLLERPFDELDLTPGSADLKTLVTALDNQYTGHMDWRDLEATVNLYAWITRQFSYDDRVQQWFAQFVEEQDAQEELGVWSNYATAFPEWLAGKRYDPETWELLDPDEADAGSERIVLQPVLGGGFRDHVASVYTYNHDNWLSRDVVITTFSFAHATWCLIQLHNGCDARSGISKPFVYQYVGDGEHGYIDWSNGTVSCSNDDTELGDEHYWYYSGSWGYQAGWGGGDPELAYYDAFDLADDEVDFHRLWAELGPGPRKPFSPAALYKHIRDVELPNLERCLKDAPYAQPYSLTDHLTMLCRCEDLTDDEEHVRIYRRLLLSVHTTGRLGIRLFDGDNNVGYCPICGHELTFTPEGL